MNDDDILSSYLMSGGPMVRYNAQGQLEPYTPGPAPDLSPAGVGNAVYDFIGGRDLQQAAEAYQRGEYLPAMGQGAWGAAQVATLPIPGVKAATMGAKGLGFTVENLAKLAADTRGAGQNPFRAYHASPFDFNEFRTGFERSGSGGLSQGYGTYVAQHEPVSLDYLRGFKERSAGWEPPPEAKAEGVRTPINAVLRAIDNARAGGLNPNDLVPHPQTIFGELMTGMRRGQSLDDFTRFVNEANWSPEKKNMYLSGIEALRPWKWRQGTGHMYEVDVHADPQRFMDWDVPLSQQHNTVENVIQDIRRREGIPGGDYVGARAYSDMAEHFRRQSGIATSDEAYKYLAELLDKQGVPGTRYLDQLSRNLPNAVQRQWLEEQIAKLRAMGPHNLTENDLRDIANMEATLARQPTSNFAIADPRIIQIMRKYGILGPAAVGAAATQGAQQ